MSPKRQRVPRVTDAEIAEAQKHNWEASGVSARNKGQLLYLKFGTDTGHTATVCLDPTRAAALVRVLNGYLPVGDDAPSGWKSDVGDNVDSFAGDWIPRE